MKRPSFQFYPGDWRQNANLRRCSPAARGVWMDIMCLLHDSDEYGLLRWPLKEIARAAAASMSHVRELVEKGVLKGTEKGNCEAFIYTPRSGRKNGPPVTLLAIQAGPIWYSSRMVKDEYVRTIRGESSGSGDPSKAAPKPPIGDGFGPRGSSSSSSASLDTEDFNVSPGASDLADDSAFGDDPPPPDAPPPEGEDGDGLPDAAPSPYGLIAKAIKEAGIMANPGHPSFRLLVDAGATALEFLAFADRAKTMRDPFAYLLGCVEGEREKAKALAGRIHHGAMPAPAPTAKEQRKTDEMRAWFGSAFQPNPDEEAHGTAPALR